MIKSDHTGQLFPWLILYTVSEEFLIYIQYSLSDFTKWPVTVANLKPEMEG